MIWKAKVKVMEQHTLDSFFLDEKIKELVTEELYNVLTNKCACFSSHEALQLWKAS